MSAERACLRGSRVQDGSGSSSSPSHALFCPRPPRRLQSCPRARVPSRSNEETAMGEASPGRHSSEALPSERLDSWKEIATHFDRDVTTVQRWEKREGMPVHRHLHDRAGSIYAFTAELDEWARGRTVRVVHEQVKENGKDIASPIVPALPPLSVVPSTRAR